MYSGDKERVALPHYILLYFRFKRKSTEVCVYFDIPVSKYLLISTFEMYSI
jgi:hypothetical protein